MRLENDFDAAVERGIDQSRTTLYDQAINDWSYSLLELAFIVAVWAAGLLLACIVDARTAKRKKLQATNTAATGVPRFSKPRTAMVLFLLVGTVLLTSMSYLIVWVGSYVASIVALTFSVVPFWRVI
jgi:hypothetical protein